MTNRRKILQGLAAPALVPFSAFSQPRPPRIARIGLLSYLTEPDVAFTMPNKGKGARPGAIPIEQASKFELVVNMKTARTLGIKIPQSILVQTTKVIE